MYADLTPVERAAMAAIDSLRGYPMDTAELRERAVAEVVHGGVPEPSAIAAVKRMLDLRERAWIGFGS